MVFAGKQDQFEISIVPEGNSIFTQGGGRISVPNFSLVGNTSYTLESWVKFSGDSFKKGNDYHTILEFGNDAPWCGVQNLDGSNGQLNLYGGAAGGVVPVGEWTHVAASFDGAVSRVYVNGDEVASAERKRPKQKLV